LNLFQRFVGLLIGVDGGVNALGGGSPRETLSGTCGRGVLAGKWWAKPVAYMIDGLLGEGHCLRQAAAEARRRG
jgi:hypothetical protein